MRQLVNKYLMFLFIIINKNYLFGQNDSLGNLLDMSIEELMQIKVVTASGKEESRLEAGATMVVIRAEDIQKQGYTDLTEIISNLPGFDVVNPNGKGGVVAYQRGYRTPITQRTLIMINGIVDNDLWSHEALIGKHYPIYNIERIEVLYGPTSALYGANAFLGIINIITKNGEGLESDGQKVFVSAQFGSNSTKSMELATIGKKGDFAYSFSGKFYRSDEADLSDKWGFSSNKLYSDTNVWGPVLQKSHYNVPYGKYYSPADDYGVLADVSYKGTKLGLINWVNKEGYGSVYAADRAQNNAFWKKSSFQLYLENKFSRDKLNLNTLILYRKNRVWGDFAEAEPDWHTGMSQYSYISITNWNCLSSSWLFKEDFNYDFTKKISLQAGIKYERKELTKAYDIPGYWDAFSSTVPTSNLGPHGYGAAIGHSQDSIYETVQGPAQEMPADNLLLTDDVGGYLQFTAHLKQLKFIGGARYDYNSIFGENNNIRASLIYQFKQKGALKLIYGEAYQEPPPRQLFGGWNGRKANVNLKPEKAKNIELVGSYGKGIVAVGTSVFYSIYENVIKEEAENAGERKIYGAELRSIISVRNLLPKSPKITSFFYYTYTQAYSSIHFNHTTKKWENGETELGDIAPHKINAGINLPIFKYVNFNIRGNYVSERLVYTRNTLRAKDYKIAPYFTMDCNLAVKFKAATLAFKVKNIADVNYYHPGVEQADSGDDFSKRSLGYRNSLLPQMGRNYMVSLNIDL